MGTGDVYQQRGNVLTGLKSWELIIASQFSMTPIIIDIEASGFGAMSYPVEVGVAMASGQRHSMLVLPVSDWTHWDESAESLHQISREVLLAHGRPVQDVANRLNSLLAGQATYSDGWVVDRPWIGNLFHVARVAMQFTLSPIEQLMSEAQLECWDTVKLQVIDEGSETRHRASYDAWVIQQTFLRSHAMAAM